jgi:hypothetical protein
MAEEKDPKTIKTHYIKNSDFRTVFSSSIYGGLTINGLININFCVDRTTIPFQTESIADEKGLKEVSKQSKDGLVKEVQFGTLIDVQTAKALVTWLNEQIKKDDEIQQHISKTKK